MSDCCSRKLGLPTKEFMDELRFREEMIEKVFKAQQTIIMAGTYELGTRIKARIVQWKNLNNFAFKVEILTKGHFRMMKSVRDIKYKDSSHMYLARPHTSDLGQIKLLYEPKGDQMHRCQIEDLYTVNQGGRLKMLATVLMIDKGKRIQYVDFNNLYDTPQSISYYTEIEPECKFGRVYFGDLIPKDFLDKSINQYCYESLGIDLNRKHTLEILGFDDNIYHLDFIDHEGKSLICHLKEKFHDQLVKNFEHRHRGQETNGHGKNGYVFSELDVVRHMKKPTKSFPRNFGRSFTARGRAVEPVVPERPRKRYYGVVEYFREKILAINDLDGSESYLQKRLFKVKVICWDDPETFFIIPHDPDYYSEHYEFTRDLEARLGISNNEPERVTDYDKPYSKGQLCLFRNELDYKLGKWLRGVIIEVPCTTTNGTISLPNGTASDNNEIKSETTMNISLKSAIDKFVYKVRSIDYGFQCIRSPPNLRHVQDEPSFLRKSPWALRCRLFGIEPIEYDTESSCGYSSFCLEMIDSWMRSKTLDECSSLSVLFRAGVVNSPNTWQSDDYKLDISLFHHHEPPYRIEDSIMPRRRRSLYESLNWFLVERGLASDHIRSLKASSNIELDQHVVNLLVPHDRI